MKSAEIFNHRVMGKDCFYQSTLKYTSSTDSSDSSVSSILLSLCPLSIDSNNYLLNSDNLSQINTPRIENKFQHNNFRSLNVNSTDGHSIQSYSSIIEEKYDNDTQSITSENQIKRKPSFNRLIDLLSRRQSKVDSSSTDSSNISIQSCLNKLLLELKNSDEIESKECSHSCTSTSIRPEISPERINHFKQRQIELEYTIEKLLEKIIYETNKNIKQISKYWSYIRQISLDKYRPKDNPYQLFDYILKSTYMNREYELYFEQNDEIKASLQVLSTTLDIVHDQFSFTILERSFNEEEKNLRENLQSQLECLISAYKDELSFTRERIRFYQLNENKTFDWIQIVQIDYPHLIEKISNDFLIEIPQIKPILIQLLRNTKKHLLNISYELNKK